MPVSVDPSYVPEAPRPFIVSAQAVPQRAVAGQAIQLQANVRPVGQLRGDGTPPREVTARVKGPSEEPLELGLKKSGDYWVGVFVVSQPGVYAWQVRCEGGVAQGEVLVDASLF